jgi:hypothetical protein
VEEAARFVEQNLADEMARNRIIRHTSACSLT